MKIKNNYTTIDIHDLFGDNPKFVGAEASYYDRYENGKKVEDNIGTKITVIVHIPSKGVRYEKLDVKVLGANPSNFRPDELVRFKNLKLSVSKVEFSFATLVGTADSYEMIAENIQEDNQPIKNQIKLDSDKK